MLRYSFTLNYIGPQMTLRRDAQTHSKMVPVARLPVSYCIMVHTVGQRECVLFSVIQEVKIIKLILFLYI